MAETPSTKFPHNSLKNVDQDQENSLNYSNFNNKNKNLIGEGTKILGGGIGGGNGGLTPRAKNVLTNRKVLAEKTPNNSKLIK